MSWIATVTPSRKSDSTTTLPTVTGPRVAVIGAGVGGLTAAYALRKKGYHVTVFEASERLGGRIMTERDAFSSQGQHCEMGGEWIDSTHHDIRKLAHELGLDIQDISKKRTGQELFYFGDTFYAPSDFLMRSDEGTQTKGDYLKLANYIRKDREKAKRKPAYEKLLDNMSIEDYLNQAQAKTGTPWWVIDSIKMAYKGEFGTECKNQSALLLINQIGTGPKRTFEVYGPKQDESQRIKGGNDALINALQSYLQDHGVAIRCGQALTKITGQSPAKGISIELAGKTGKESKDFDYVVCALPFTKLREVDGLDALVKAGQLSPEKLHTIQKLGYGNITKLMLGMNGRPWENCNRFPCPSNGSFRSDNPYLQNTWITSVGQHGDDSILTVLIAGNEAKQPEKTIRENCKNAFAHMLGMRVDEVFNHRAIMKRWPNEVTVKASYSAMRPGQYTTMREIAGTPECNGRLGFVGEHTDPELYGYMSGAVSSALREAERIGKLEQFRSDAKYGPIHAAAASR